MCECLCAEPKGHMTYKIGNTVLSVSAYMGCRECDAAIGIDLHPFTIRGAKEWLQGHTPKLLEPSAEGIGIVNGVKNSATSFEMFSIEDVAKVLDGWKPEVVAECETLGEWFREDGLSILQQAFRACQERHRAKESR